MSLIRFEEVSLEFGDQKILSQADFAIEPGERVCLIGRNGAGKSTLLRLLATLTTPDTGTLNIGGLDLSRGGQEARRLIGVVTHDSLLYENLTAYENLAFHARMFGLDQIRERIESATSTMGMSDRLHQRVTTLSHGLRKRLSIIRALLHEPRILLMDEPESGLDQEALRMLDLVISDRTDPYRTVVMTTHNLGRAMERAVSMAILSHGRVAYHGPLGSVSNQSVHDTYTNYTDGRL